MHIPYLPPSIIIYWYIIASFGVILGYLAFSNKSQVVKWAIYTFQDDNLLFIMPKQAT